MGVHHYIESLRICIFFLFLCIGISIQAQSDGGRIIENMVKGNSGDNFKINGSFRSSITGNTVSGMERRIDPFRYRFGGAFRIQAFGLSAGASLHFANSNRIYNLNLPDIKLPSFFLFGISPTYKAATLHLGYRHMYFSDYSLSGHAFYGSGLELKPGKFRLSAMYGRLRRARQEEMGLRQSLDPRYKRMGWGVNLGYQSDAGEIYFILFNARDEKFTLLPSQETIAVAPAENAILSVKGKKPLGKILSIDFDYAMSAYTRDRRQDELVDIRGISILERAGGLFTPRIGSTFQKALKTKLSFRTSWGNITAGHERVDPDYRTLGALFFNNDYENFTLGTQMQWKENKWMVNAETGFQRNNLSGDETNSLRRIVGSAQISFRPNDVTHFNVNYSNFRTTNKLRTSTIPFIQVDSITLSLVNQNIGFTFNRLSGNDNTNVLTGSFSYQKSNAIENDAVLQSQTNDNIMAFINYSMMTPADWRMSTSFMMNRNNNFINNLLTIAPTLGAKKDWKEKNLRVQSSLSMVRIYLDNAYFNTVWQPRASVDYQVSKKQSLSFEAYYVLRSQSNNLENSFSELTSTLSWRVRL